MFNNIKRLTFNVAKLAGCFAVAVAVCSAASFAAEDSKPERFFSESGAISFSEKEVEKGETVYLWVIPGDVTWKETNADETILNTAVFVGKADAEVQGRERIAVFKFILPADGKYTALSRGSKRTIIYADKDTAISKTAELKTLSREQVASFIDANGAELSVSTDLYSAKNADAAGMVYDYIQSNPDVTASEIGAVIDKAYLIDAINDGTVTDIGDYLYSSGIAGSYDYADSDNGAVIEKIKGATGISDFDKKIAEVCPPSTETGGGTTIGTPGTNGGNGNGSSGSSGSGGSGGGGYNSNTNNKANNTLIDLSEYAPESKNDIAVMSFSDMAGHEWAAEAVNFLYMHGIISGMTEDTYCPGQNVKREEFAKLLIEMTKLNVVKDDIKFTDVPKDAWFYNSVNRAYKAGIVKGVSEELFGAGMDITREDMAVMIHNTLYVCGEELPEASAASFSDAAEISDYASEAVSNLVELDVLSGYSDGTFKPQATATRAEAAQVIYNALKLLSE